MNWKQEAGKKPTKKLLIEASYLVRKNTKDHIAVAMAMRPSGVTQSEIKAVLGYPHRNKIRKLIQDNKVRRFVLPESTKATRIRLIKR